MDKKLLDLKHFPILVVDDEQDNLDAFRFNFRKLLDMHTALNGPEALKILENLDAAVLVTDQRMPGMSGLELLKEASKIRPDAVGIIITAFSDMEVLIEAINLGQVYRYIAKPWDSREVRGILQQAIERFHLRRENARLNEQLCQYAGYLEQQAHDAFDFGNIIGQAPTLKEVLTRVEQVAPTASTVLLRGETGTGKELVARAIHLNSDRADKPFVAVNCAAISPELLESELFGHEKGAFTGAVGERKGRFELADGGTLFLDEAGDIPANVQVKLLRVLQEREFERVGGTRPISVDVRIISATNRDLEAMISDGKFRQDLYYRLNVFPIVLPPLRERGDDVLLLAEHFLEKFATRNRRGPRMIAADAQAALKSYPWPGNVRELQNIIERSSIIAIGAELTAQYLDLQTPTKNFPLASSSIAKANTNGQSIRSRLADEEKAAILLAVENCRGNIAATARNLGINRSTLYFRLKKHGLDYLLPTKPTDS